MLAMYLTISILFLLFSAATTAKCKTPNNEDGECISLYLCPALLEKLGTKQNSEIEFVRKSGCGFCGSEPLTCCVTTPPIPIQPKPINNTNKLNLLPNRSYCGYQHSDDYFRVNQTGLAINEHPWLALLLYRRTGDEQIRVLYCSGSLISNRYVLTAAHCVFIQQTKLAGVRLGEYNIHNDTDCTNEMNLHECSDPPQDVGIKTVIVHPGYSIQTHINDICLLRLNKTIQFSDYIRPICLPFTGTIFSKPGDILTSTGIDGQAVKNRVLKTVITMNECTSLSSKITNVSRDKQFCLMEIANATDYSCKSYSGAPVIFSRRNQWHQEGIISFGPGCGIRFPEIITKVVSYLEWIVDMIKP